MTQRELTSAQSRFELVCTTAARSGYKPLSPGCLVFELLPHSVEACDIHVLTYGRETTISSRIDSCSPTSLAKSLKTNANESSPNRL